MLRKVILSLASFEINSISAMFSLGARAQRKLFDRIIADRSYRTLANGIVESIGNSLMAIPPRRCLERNAACGLNFDAIR